MTNKQVEEVITLKRQPSTSILPKITIDFSSISSVPFTDLPDYGNRRYLAEPPEWFQLVHSGLLTLILRSIIYAKLTSQSTRMLWLNHRLQWHQILDTERRIYRAQKPRAHV